jgi:shikimate kinase
VNGAIEKAVVRPILLVGMMGAGKSTIGRLLAGRLTLPFVDTDAELESQFGRRIAEIFEDPGEASFRNRERLLMCKLIEGPPCVIATGGGAFMNQAVRRSAGQKALSIWLDAPIEVLAARISLSTERPLLTGDPLDVLAKLDEKRRGAYSQSDLRVQIDWQDPDEIVAMIIDAIEGMPSDQALP